MIKIKKKGWIIFMTFSSWATLLAGCKKWSGDQSPVEITTEAPVAIADIQEISFRESGSMIPLVSYVTMTRENEGYVLKFKSLELLGQLRGLFTGN